MKRHKGQAAIEYLIDYIWAIVIISFVITQLFFLYRMFGLPDMCMFSPYVFMCNKPIAYVDNNSYVHVVIKVINQNPSNVDIHYIGCSNDRNPDVVRYSKLKLTLTSQSSKVFSVPCYTSDGQPLKGTEGDVFRGYVFIRYNFADDPSIAPNRLTVASIVSRIVKSG